VRAFYQAEGWQAVWTEDAEKALRQTLDQRAAHGLDRIEFLTATADGAAAREAALTRAALGYASALAKGMVDPKDLYKIYTVLRPDPNLAAGLLRALQDESLPAWLQSLAPKDAEYRALSRVYLKMREAASGRDGGSIPETDRPLRPGSSDPRIPQIAAALRTIGYLAEAGGEGSEAKTLYTPALAEAVRRLQEDSGQEPNGVIGRDTLDALNRGAADRMRAAAVALERRRWLLRKPPAKRIDVNTAAAILSYVRGGQIVDRRRVIAGQPGWETPQLQAALFRLVANPTWTVPKSIEEKELAGVSADYLRRHNMIRKDGWIVQQSGPDNSLGLVKFDLDDEFAIYLHDTPAKAVFESDARHRSHGCVRVADALGFAQTLAGDERITAAWQRARQSGEETFVKLPQPIPVRLLYHPTWLDPSGRIRFEPDVYGWNDHIARQLGFGPGRARRLAPPVDDIGP
jgi:murein L,D-transpeptidase YcbB/YkuD